MFTALTLLQFHGLNIVVLASFLHGLFIAFIHRHLRARGDSSIFYSNGCAAFGSFPNYVIFFSCRRFHCVLCLECHHASLHASDHAIILDHLGKPHDRLASEYVLPVIHNVLER